MALLLIVNLATSEWFVSYRFVEKLGSVADDAEDCYEYQCAKPCPRIVEVEPAGVEWEDVRVGAGVTQECVGG